MSVSTRKVDERSRVVLPVGFAGRTVAIEAVNESEVRVRIVKAPRRRPSLDELLSGVTKNNQHKPVEFGAPRGDEAL
jgi:antitoxin component of MazEF toxin-antitoxin module